MADTNFPIFPSLQIDFSLSKDPYQLNQERMWLTAFFEIILWETNSSSFSSISTSVISLMNTWRFNPLVCGAH